MKTLFTFVLVAVAASVCNAQWVQTNGPYGGSVYALAVSGTNLFAGTDGRGVFLSTNNGTNWTAVNSGLTDTNVYSLGVSATNLFAGTFLGGAFLSTNNGTSWTAVNNGLPRFPYDTSSYYHINCFAVNGTNLFAGTNLGVFRSTNNGTSWVAAGLTDSSVAALAVSGSNLFAGTYWGGVSLSTNNGTSWTQSGLTNTVVGAFALSDTNLFAGTNLGVFRSTNNGTSWVAAGLVHISALAVSGTNLFAGTGNCGGRSCHDSLFLSTNNGTSWTAVNTGLPTNSYLHALAVSGTNLFAVLTSAPFIGGSPGVWRRPLSEMITDVESEQQLPTRFVLEQNYPNPFNPATTIRYGLPHNSFVTLTVYNTLGQQVAQLVNEQQQAGYHDAVFRGDGLASGVYMYQLRAGAFVSTKKFLLLR